LERCGTDAVDDLHMPPPASSLYFTNAMSGSTPVVRNPEERNGARWGRATVDLGVAMPGSGRIRGRDSSMRELLP